MGCMKYHIMHKNNSRNIFFNSIVLVYFVVPHPFPTHEHVYITPHIASHISQKRTNTTRGNEYMKLKPKTSTLTTVPSQFDGSRSRLETARHTISHFLTYGMCNVLCIKSPFAHAVQHRYNVYATAD